MTKDTYNKNSNKNDKLVLGIDKKGLVIQFNSACEQSTGFTRDEILNKKIEDTLIQKQFIDQWNKLLNSARNEEEVKDISIPWVDYKGNEVNIIWNTLSIKSKNGTIEDVCLVGKNLGKIKKIYSNTEKKTMNKENNKMKKEITNPPNIKKTKPNALTTKHSEIKITDYNLKRKIIPLKNNNQIHNIKGETEEKNIEVKDEQTTNTKPRKKIKVKIRTQPKREISNNNEKFKSITIELEKKYEKINEKIQELEIKDKKLERKNKRLEKNIGEIKSKLGYKKHDKLDFESDHESESFSNVTKLEKSGNSNKLFGFFQDPFGQKRRELEYQKRIDELTDSKRNLNELKNQLINDKKTLDSQRDQFQKWKDKLENLEIEIEKRKLEIQEQELAFNNRLTQTDFLDENNTANDNETDESDYHSVLDKIPQSAAVIQRGILKQINKSFSELLGYSPEEIQEKNLFDLIDPDGLPEVKQYYLNRLKGDDAGSYDTIFSTKENEKIFVTVSTKPTLFNGDKAEIAVVNEIELKNENIKNDANDQDVIIPEQKEINETETITSDQEKEAESISLVEDIQEIEPQNETSEHNLEDFKEDNVESDQIDLNEDNLVEESKNVSENKLEKKQKERSSEEIDDAKES